MHQAAMNFDTHKSIKLLIAEGIKESQAESIVEVVSQSREYDMSQLATKEQLNSTKLELQKDIDLVEEKLEKKITNVHNNILKWMISLMTGMMLSILAVVAKLFFT